MKIIIKGNPIAKARHRSSNRGKVTFRKGHMQVIPQLYDPKSEEKKQVTEFLKKTLMLAKLSKDKQIASEAHGLAQDGAFSVKLSFYLPIGDSLPIATKNARKWGFEKPICKPDIDNLEKFYLDCANKILFPDDKMIVDVIKTKSYSDSPRVEIDVTKIPNESKSEEMQVLLMFSPQEFEQFLKDSDFQSFWNSSESRTGENTVNAIRKIVAFAHKYNDILRRIVSKTTPKKDKVP